MNVLIIEDQHYPLDALTIAVNKVVPKYDSSFTKDQLHIAKSYTSAQARIASQQYDLVLLDHRMPREDDTRNLEETDFNAFSRSLQNIGYGLLPYIRQRSPNAIVIGTSSLSQSEIGLYELPRHKMSKMYGDAENDLERILSEICT
jgi:CheY-like chemotaxis protein